MRPSDMNHTLPILSLAGTPAPGQLPRRVASRVRDDGDVVQVRTTDACGNGDILLLSEVPETLDAQPSDIRGIIVIDGRELRGWWRSDGRFQRTEVLGSGAGTLARNAGLIETDALADRSVAVIGLGSGGSMIADHLARAGVGRLVLIDRDRIEIQNVGRHLCDVEDLGRNKVLAVRDRLLARNPAMRVDTVQLDVMADPDALARAVEECHVLVGATDNNPSRRVVNRLAVATGRPAVFGRAYTRACGGDVIRVSQGGPCYDCLFGTVDADEEVTRADAPDVPAYADRPVQVEPGLALDISPIAHMCARLVLQELVRGRSSALEALDDDLPGSMFLWANRREGNFAVWKPMRFGMSDFAVMRWYGMRATRGLHCPTCNEDAFLERLLATEALSWS